MKLLLLCIKDRTYTYTSVYIFYSNEKNIHILHYNRPLNAQWAKCVGGGGGLDGGMYPSPERLGLTGLVGHILWEGSVWYVGIINEHG